MEKHLLLLKKNYILCEQIKKNICKLVWVLAMQNVRFIYESLGN